MRKLILFYLLSLSLVLLACGGKSKKDEKVRANVEALIVKDISSGVKSGVDMATGGLGSTLLNVVMDREKQDSLIASPIIKYVKQDIEKADIKDLKPLEKDSKARYLFLGKCMVNHKDEIHNAVKEKIGVETDIVEKMIEFFNNSMPS